MDTKVPLVAGQKIEKLLAKGVESFGLWPGAQYSLRFYGHILDHQQDVSSVGITNGDKIDLQRVQRSLPFNKSTPVLLAIVMITFVLGGIVFYLSEFAESITAIVLSRTDRAKQKWNEIEWL